MSPRSDSARGEAERSSTDNGETIGQPSLARRNRATPDGATAAYGVVRDDVIWITECAWCQRVRSAAGAWHAPSPAIRAVNGVERTHGICPECAHAAVARADEIVDGRP